MRLLKEFNDSGMAEFMQSHSGESVTTQSFLDAVDRAFHDDAHKRLQLSCNGGKLVDIYIRLPKEIDEESSLSELIKRSPANFKNACGEKFTVDVIGQ
jgi:ribonuclease T2